MLLLCEDPRLLAEKLLQNGFRFLKICRIGDPYLQFQKPDVIGGHIGKTVVGQKTVWKNDDFLVNGGKPGVEDMDFFYSSFISFIVFPDVVTDNEGL